MARINLLGGTYQARSIIANAQRCVNLYPEKNPEDASAPFTHQLTPGLTLKREPLAAGAARGMYTATNGGLYYVCAQEVYFVDDNFNIVLLGSISSPFSTPVGMQDNGHTIIIVDGTTNGWAIDLASNAFAPITDPNFLGGTSVDYCDTFFVLNQPGTRNFYSSLSDITFFHLTNAPGTVISGVISAGGAGGVDGVYPGVAFTGGTGVNFTATVTVAGGTVTVVSVTNAGLGYQAGQLLSATPGGVVGFFYQVTDAGPIAFDPTYVAVKTGYPDLLAGLVVVHREIWLMGAFESAEVWYDAGGATFPFQIMPGVFIQHGCVAPYSICTHDLLVFWLGIDDAGQGTFFMGAGYQAKRISTWAIANIISQIIAAGQTLDDCIGMVYKQMDHVFVMFTFPSADRTLVYDLTENLWHERSWADPDTGDEHRIRAACVAIAYGVSICGDWENGNIYLLDLNNYTDNGDPIVRRRGMPHLLNDGKRVSYNRFALDMQCGEGLASDPTYEPQVTLRVSDDRGKTYWNTPMQSLGKTGSYLAQPVWHQLGMARDRVFEVTWSDGVFTALNGAWLDAEPSET